MAKPNDPKLEQLLKAALAAPPDETEQPDPLLNCQLKAKLYQKQQRLQECPGKKVSIWYLPALLNLVGCLTVSIALALLLAPSFAARMILALGLYASLAGILITLVGVRFCSWREELVIVLTGQAGRAKKKGGASI